MKLEPIKIDADTAKVWQAAQHRRAEDIGALPGRQRLAIPTVFSALVVAVAVWVVAGPPTHPVKTFAALQHARAP